MHTKGVLIPRLSRISYTFWKIRKATLSENNTSKRVICGVLCHLRLPTEDNRFSKERNREYTLSQLREKSWMSLVTSVNKLNWIEKDWKFVSGVKNWLDVMEKSSCELLSGSYPNYVSELENLRWTILVNPVFNGFLTYTTIMLNVATIHAIRKTSSLPKTLKTLLLNLAITDVGVGLIVQPVYSSLLVKWLQKNISDMHMLCFRRRFASLRSWVLWLLV